MVSSSLKYLREEKELETLNCRICNSNYIPKNKGKLRKQFCSYTCYEEYVNKKRRAEKEIRQRNIERLREEKAKAKEELKKRKAEEKEVLRKEYEEQKSKRIEERAIKNLEETERKKAEREIRREFTSEEGQSQLEKQRETIKERIENHLCVDCADPVELITVTYYPRFCNCCKGKRHKYYLRKKNAT